MLLCPQSLQIRQDTVEVAYHAPNYLHSFVSSANMTQRPRLELSLTYSVVDGGCQFMLSWAVSHGDYMWPHHGVPYNTVASCQVLKLYYLLYIDLENSEKISTSQPFRFCERK